MKSNRMTALLFASVVTCGPIAVADAQCSFDLNGDHFRDSLDLAIIFSGWGGPLGDCNGDGTTDGSDLACLLAAWGPCAGPAWSTVVEWNVNPAVVTDSALRAAITATGLPWHVRDTGSNIDMVLIPAGSFMMGCTASLDFGCDGIENPMHAITLTNSFYLGCFEVTQAQWTAKIGTNPSYFQGANYSNAAMRPVERVSYNMIANFNSLTNLRLPTEAEWEYAYRAQFGTSVTRTTFHNGTNNDALLELIAWNYPAAADETHTVGGKAANGFGLYDMSGNVWEWCKDWWGGNYYSSSPSTNPTGPVSGTYRVTRGGSWDHLSGGCRASVRNYVGTPDGANSSGGFRAARNP